MARRSRCLELGIFLFPDPRMARRDRLIAQVLRFSAPYFLTGFAICTKSMGRNNSIGRQLVGWVSDRLTPQGLMVR